MSNSEHINWFENEKPISAGCKLTEKKHQEIDNKNYFIKDGYTCNPNPIQYIDTLEDSLTYQIAVYRHAAKIITMLGLETVLDIGRGLGRKLQKFILPTGAAITGIDFSQNIAYCQNHYEFGRWLVDDIESPNPKLSHPVDFIICADVIEHLIDPDTLFRYIRNWSHENTKIIISTPERDLRRGPDDMGPPGNGAHVREWNQGEFKNYLANLGISIEDHQIVELRSGMSTCQLVIGSWIRN